MWPTSGAPSVKRKIFASYHHRGDQAYYDEFARTFGGIYEIVEDHSLDREVDSDNAEYVMRVIREQYIAGSSCTIVLCGAQTHGRKHVDWELKATLDAGHGLIALQLPTLVASNGTVLIPERLNDNIKTGYAIWTMWSDVIQSPANLTRYIELARNKVATLIDNSRPMRKRNGP
jgi:hypothetical protein